ncbi:8-amino-7-oxononanoate synthase [Cryobacterium ruanii]|uniref:8-amino-7-oxononanoate synthase n=1 Tax=Cryobacterium ruanii TaxID=1259197 RepID=A0A4R9AKC5_9MICO|nr:8-amino-7-oxononanoate synthase [Cryobacterium ruanii]TFD63686.1 8-amino-7-oxononanoate synthase [Cryobacterium ruanii]
MVAVQDRLADAARVRDRRGTVRATRIAPGWEEDAGAGALEGPLDLASNDYLGLSTDRRLKAAAIAATERYGTGARASRVVTGTLPVHTELELALAELTGQPAALAFSSGYAANLGILTALGGPDTLILSDQHIHASLVDAARLSRSPIETIPHSDLAILGDVLANRTQTRAIVVVESVYSVLGDAPNLIDTAALCAKYDALLVVDEAHGIGVLGAGRGGVYAAGLAGAEHVVVTATLSKALGAQGGAVLGSELLREHLVNTARSFIFDTGLAPAPAAAAAAGCRVILAEPERVDALHRVASLIASSCGVDRAAGPVQSIRVGTPEIAVKVTERLRDEGILVGCFRPPSVPDGISRLRLTAHAGTDPDRLLRATALISSMLVERP